MSDKNKKVLVYFDSTGREYLRHYMPESIENLEFDKGHMSYVLQEDIDEFEQKSSKNQKAVLYLKNGEITIKYEEVKNELSEVETLNLRLQFAEDALMQILVEGVK